MAFIKDFVNSGYFFQCTDIEALTALSDKQKIAAYIGFDCTAPSLHVGNLMQIMILRLLQRYGHKPIIIVGGATSKIGDPTGKDQMRKVLTDEELNNNINGIKKSLAKFIKFGEEESDAILLNNSDWLESINYIEFLREYGSLFSVNRMLTMESVKARLDRQQSLSFLEFNYMLLQAFDFYHLHKNFDCSLQLGGSDQWGNIVMGVDFVRKMTGKEVYGMTTPLLTTSSGAKMGKSVNGAVWINEELLAPYDYYQFWRNTADDDVLRFAGLYAEFSEQELNHFAQLMQDNINNAKKNLAFRLTALCHGKEAAQEAIETATKIFEQGAISENMPLLLLDSDDFISGNIHICDLLLKTGLVSSKSEARRSIRNHAVKIDDNLIDNENFLIVQSSFSSQGLKLSFGKKKHILLKYNF